MQYKSENDTFPALKESCIKQESICEANHGAVLINQLITKKFGPFFGTPCGILAPLFTRLQEQKMLTTIGREDSAIGVAAGTALAGKSPVVLMQNSGLGQSVNALASLIEPYQIPMLLLVSLRGIPPDPTPENEIMGKSTLPIFGMCNIPAQIIRANIIEDLIVWAEELVTGRRCPAALLIPPDLLGWKA